MPAPTIPTFSLKQGDTLPALVVTCYKGDGTIQDLTGATATTFSLWDQNHQPVIADAPATVVGAPTNGQLQYAWQTADTQNAGAFEGEFHVTFSGGGKLSFPSSGKIQVYIEPRIE